MWCLMSITLMSKYNMSVVIVLVVSDLMWPYKYILYVIHGTKAQCIYAVKLSAYKYDCSDMHPSLSVTLHKGSSILHIYCAPLYLWINKWPYVTYSLLSRRDINSLWALFWNICYHEYLMKAHRVHFHFSEFTQSTEHQKTSPTQTHYIKCQVK